MKPKTYPYRDAKGRTVTHSPQHRGLVSTIDKKKMQSTRKFSNSKYSYSGTYYKKNTAKSDANYERRIGNRARVVKDGKRWVVYLAGPSKPRKGRR